MTDQRQHHRDLALSFGSGAERRRASLAAGRVVRTIVSLTVALLCIATRTAHAQTLVVEPIMRDLTIRHYCTRLTYTPVLVSAGPPPVWAAWPNNAAGETPPEFVPDGFYGTLVDGNGDLTSYGATIMNAVQQAYEGLKLNSINTYVNPATIGGTSDPTNLGASDFTSFAAASVGDPGSTMASRVATISAHAQLSGVIKTSCSWVGWGATRIEAAGSHRVENCCVQGESSCKSAALSGAMGNISWTVQPNVGGGGGFNRPNGSSLSWFSGTGSNCNPPPGKPAWSATVLTDVNPMTPVFSYPSIPSNVPIAAELYLKVTNVLVSQGFSRAVLGANPPVSGTAYPNEPAWELAFRVNRQDPVPPIGVFGGGFRHPDDPWAGWIVKSNMVILRPNMRVSRSYPALQPAGGVPAIRPGSAPGLLGEGDLAGEPGQMPQGCAPVSFTSGVKSESAVDLVVAATGQPFKFEREYTSEYAYTSATDGNLVGRGWMATPFRSISVSGSGTSRVVTHFGPPLQRQLVFKNPDPTGAPDVWTSSGPATQTLVRTKLIVDDSIWPTWRLIEPGGWAIDYYRSPDPGETGVSTPPTSVVGMILQERDPYGNPRTYVYQRPNPSDTQALRARLRAIYINGSPKTGATEAEVVFTWHFQSGALNGKLDKIEVQRHIGDTNEFVTIQSVDYTYAAEGSGWSSAIGSGGDLVQVTTKERVDEVPTDSPAPEPFRTRITQYRYHNGSAVASSGTDERLLIDGAVGQLKAVIDAEQIEWYAQQRAPQESGWTAASALASAAEELLGKSDSAALGSPVGSMTVVDLAAKIVGYENSTGGRVSTQFLQSSCGCSSGSSQGVKQIYVYSGSYTAQSEKTGCTTRLEEYLGQASGAGVYDSSPYRLTYHDMEFLGPTGSTVPYLVNKAVREPGGRTWVWHSEYDANRNLSRSIMPDGAAYYASYDESTSGVPEYTASSTGLSYQYTYVNNRLSETRRGTPTATGATVSKITYDTTGAVPPHLPIKIERYRTTSSSPSADDIETTTFAYGFHGDAAAPAKLFPLAWTKTSVEAELQDENGPTAAATYDTYELYDTRGRNFWSRAADGSLTHRAFDPVTGAVTQVTRNADPITPAGNAGAPLPTSHASLSTSGWGKTGSAASATRLPGGELVTSYTYDQLGRLVRTVAPPGKSPTRATGIVGTSTYIVRGLKTLPGVTTGPYVYTETTLPHRMAGSGIEYGGPASITWQNAAGKVLAEIELAVDPSVSTYDPLASPPSYTLSSTLLSRRAVTYFASGLAQVERVWHAIKQSDLSDTAYSHARSYEYDALGRVSLVTDFDGTVTKTDHDVMDRPIRTYVGVSTATLQQVAEFYYDSQTASHAGVGNGLLGLERRFVGPSSGEPLAPDYYRDTRRVYDANGRLVKVVPPTPPYQFLGYDAQDRIIEVAESDGSLGEPSSMSSLGTDRRTYTKTFYSQRGLVYKKQVALDPENSSPSFLSSYAWFDAAGRAVEEWGPNGPATKRTFDALGRVTATYITDRGGDAAPGASGNYADAIALAGDAVLSQSLPKYGEGATRQEGRLLLERRYQRLHDSATTGALTYSSAIVTYAGHMYDDADRPIRTVDFGTHRSDVALTTGSANDEPTWPPASVPGHTWTDPGCSSCRPPAVSAIEYDARGFVAAETDALGHVKRYVYDDMGRRGVIIENSTSITAASVSWDWTGGDWSISGLSNSGAPDQDRVTTMLYDGAGRTTQQAVYNVTGTGSPSQPYKQTTRYIYGTSSGSASTATDSLVASNALLAEVQYPGETDGSVQPSDNAFKVRYSYNRQGERRSVTDQNGTLHVFRLDAAGRMISDTVEAINTSLLDNTVKRIGYTYDGMGRRSKVTSYDQLSPSETVLNEVQFTYTSMGQVARVYQNPDGAVLFDSSGEPLSGGTRVVRYGYTGTSTAASNNYSRLETLTYPDGTVVNQIYNQTGSSGSVDATISRLVRTEIDGSTPIPLVEYRHLGAGTVVTAALAKPAIRLDYTLGAAGSSVSGQYPGFDHRGRPVRQSWVDQGFAAGMGGVPNRPPILMERFDYDRLNRTRRSDERPGRTWTDRDAGWTFDGLNRLALERRGVYDAGTQTWTSSAGGPQPSREYSHDALGNWLTTALDTNADGTFATGEREARTHNQANELTGRSIPGASTVTVADTLDDAGTLRTSATTIGSVTTTTFYTHDAWNRLVAWSVNSTSGWTGRYYGLHWRAKVVQPSGAEARSFYDASWRMLEDRTKASTVTSEAVNQYFWGTRHLDDIVARRIDSGTLGDHSDDTLYFHVTDAQFNTRAVLRPSGSSAAAVLVERVEYDAYGTARHHWPGDTDGDGDYDATDESVISGLASVSIGGSGYSIEADLDRSGTIDTADATLAGGSTYRSSLALGELSPAGGNTLGFCGYVYDKSLSMYQVRHRWYHPNRGRWIERDPAGCVDGCNLYEYCNGGPWDGSDPMGLWEWDNDWVETAVDLFLPTQQGSAARSGFAQGARDGAVIAANTYTFGMFSGLDCESRWLIAENGGLYAAAAWSATISREAFIFAATAGLGQVANGTVRGSGLIANGLKAMAKVERLATGARWANNALAAYQVGTGLYNVGAGAYQIGRGDLAGGLTRASLGALMAIGGRAELAGPVARQTGVLASQTGRNVGAGGSVTRQGLISGLRGFTQQGDAVSASIASGRTSLNVLGDELFARAYRLRGGTGPAPQAFAWGDRIYLRQGSRNLLSDAVHEGTHAIDYINDVRGTVHQWEVRAFSAEREFQLAGGGAVEFLSYGDMIRFITEHY